MQVFSGITQKSELPGGQIACHKNTHQLTNLVILITLLLIKCSVGQSILFACIKGQAKGKAGALAQLAMHLQNRVVHVQYLFYDGQPQAGAAVAL